VVWSLCRHAMTGSAPEVHSYRTVTAFNLTAVEVFWSYMVWFYAPCITQWCSQPPPPCSALTTFTCRVDPTSVPPGVVHVHHLSAGRTEPGHPAPPPTPYTLGKHTCTLSVNTHLYLPIPPAHMPLTHLKHALYPCRVDPTRQCPQALCMCTTRELVAQNLAVLRRMAKYTNISSTSTAEDGGAESRNRKITEQVRLGVSGWGPIEYVPCDAAIVCGDIHFHLVTTQPSIAGCDRHPRSYEELGVVPPAGD
jgi:hypothetical protein